MKKIHLLTAAVLFFGATVKAQNFGIGTNAPSNKLHVKPGSGILDPVRFENLKNGDISTDSILVVTQGATGTNNGASGAGVVRMADAKTIANKYIWPYHSNNLTIGPNGNRQGIIALPGNSQVASGLNSHAEGETVSATSDFGWSVGKSITNSGQNTYALGEDLDVTAGWSMVSGYNHTVNGDNLLGGKTGHTVFGEGNTVNSTVSTGSYNFVSGRSNTVDGRANSLSGENNNVSGVYNNVSGQSNIVSGNATGGWNSVSGFDNRILGATNYENVVGGESNRVDGNINAVFGGGAVGTGGNVVTGNKNLVSGQSHNITSSFNAVSGTSNTVSSTNNQVAGANNTIAGDGYNAVFGQLNSISSSNSTGWNLLFGYNNRINGLGIEEVMLGGINNTVTGLKNGLVVGEGNTVGGSNTSMLVTGRNLTLSTSGSSSGSFITGINNTITSTDYSASILVARNATVTNSTSTFGFGDGISIVNANNSVTMNDGTGALASAGANTFTTRYSNGYNLYSGPAVGATLAAGATSWTALSDVTTKENIRNNTYGLRELLGLKTYTYNYIGNSVTKRNIGVMAQDVKAIMPELVENMPNGKLGVTSTEMIPVLIKAIQEQQVQIAKQQAQIDDLIKSSKK
jgi:trimeric autotransporter adhesin